MTQRVEVNHLLILTGASSGFGRSLCEVLAARIRIPMHAILIGRSREELQETSISMVAARGGRAFTHECIRLDLSSPVDFIPLMERIFNGCQDVKYSDITFVSNAGSLGEIDSIGRLSTEHIQRTIQLNFATPSAMISEFIRRCKLSQRPGQRVSVVNISSLWALEPCKTFSSYCASKAGIEMFMKCLAIENATPVAEGPVIKVLNYAPGPMNTAMQHQIRSTLSVDTDVQAFCKRMLDENKLVDTYVSAVKCARLIIEHMYSTGTHIDFYDQVEGIDFPSSKPTTCCNCSHCQCGPSCQCRPKMSPDCDPCADFASSKLNI